MDPQDQFRWAERPTDEDDRRRRRRHTLGIAAAVVAAVAVLAALPALWIWLPRPGDADAASYAKGSVPEGISVTTSESAVPTDPADPFTGTAAARYPKGAAGITLPAAKAVKGFSAKEVGAALTRVRAAMIAGRLDQTMLVEHEPAKFLGMLNARNRKDIKAWFASDDFSSVATWISPSAKLDPKEQPRVNGRITYASVKVDDVQTLRVTTNFVWAYAFLGTDRPIAIVHDEIAWEFPDRDEVESTDLGMWIGDTGSYMAWIDCAEATKGLLAPGRPEFAAPADTTNPDDLLRPDHSLDVGNDC